MKRPFRASYKIAIGFTALALLAIYGYRYGNDYLLGREHFPPLVPGHVNILGINTEAGYGILVQNRTAKLVVGSKGAFGAGAMDERALEDSSADRKFIPIKDMLKGLQGDIPGLSYFVQRLNDISDDDLHPMAPVWKLEDIEKALDDDKRLQAKLIHDLNMNLDGSPLDHVSTNALFNGIVIDTPVPLQITMGTERKKIVARVQQPYRPAFLSTVENRISGKFATNQIIAAEYGVAAAQVKSGELQKENIPLRLRGFSQDAKKLGPFPQEVLDSITTVISENQITGASYRAETTSKGKAYTLVINLTDEGRKRLWQFSRDRVGAQLLVTVNGVAIAAPFIAHQLSDGEILVRGLEEESLVQDAVDTINAKRATTTK